jgi:hypothetical protein
MYVQVVRPGMVPDVVDHRRSHPLGTTAGPTCSIPVPDVVGVAQEVHDDGPVYTHHSGMNVPGDRFVDVGPLELEADSSVPVEVARSELAGGGIDLGETVQVRLELVISAGGGRS